MSNCSEGSLFPHCPASARAAIMSLLGETMYERFTDRARKVMQLASQETRRFNHHYIGTEHILLGLVKEGHGVAANVLKDLGADLGNIRSEVEKLMVPGLDKADASKPPLPPSTIRVIEYMIKEARSLNHNYVGTEHVLLGLLREQEGVAAQVLMGVGVKLENAREEILKLLGVNPEGDELQQEDVTVAQDLNMAFMHLPEEVIHALKEIKAY